MTRVEMIFALLGVALVGLGRVLQSLLNAKRKVQDASQFLGALQRYILSAGDDTDSYCFLLDRSHRMQSDMGSFGIWKAFKPPFANYAIPNYPILLNAIPEMRRWSGSGPFGDRPHEQFGDFGSCVQDALIRYRGALHDEAAELHKQLCNPYLVQARTSNGATLAINCSPMAWDGPDTSIAGA